MTLSDFTENVDFNEYIHLKQRYLEVLSKFTFLIDAIPDMAFIIDRSGVFKEFYPGQQKDPPFSREDTIGKNLLEVLPADPSIGILHWIKETISTGKHFTYQFKLNKFENIDGIRDYEVRGMRYSDNLVLILVRDITENVKIQNELIESEEKYRVLVENSMDLIWKIDQHGKIVYLNKAWEKTHGYKLNDMIGKLFIDFQDKEMIERDIQAFKTLTSQNHIKNYYTKHISKNGNVIHLIFNAYLIYNDQGQYLGMQGTAYDISYRKKVENELLKSSKLESLGILAGGLAHDFNNLLTGISGNVSLMQDITKGDPELDILSSEVLEVISKASKLTQQLLTFSKGGTPSKRRINVGKLLYTTTNFILRGSNVNSEIEIDKDLWPIDADESQIDQVFQNILINSIQAMREGGTIIIRATNGKPLNWDQFPVSEKNFITINIVDSGIGISSEDLDRVFDPFYTTKPNGTGLGLTTAYSIIQRHNGDIRISSVEGTGTTITIVLPATLQSIKSHVQIPNDTAKLLTYSKRILVMDDDPIILNVYGRILSRLGCEYTLVKDGLSVLEEYHKGIKSSQGYDGVILDLTIPGGMGGKETIIELKKMDPTVRAIVSTGYSDESFIANFKEVGFSYRLDKPFSLSDVENLINNL